MDAVQKAVLHHTFGISTSSKRKYVSCNVCQLRFNSQSQALSHYKGTKHAKKLKSLDVPKYKKKSSAVMRENRMEPEKNLSPPAPPSTTEKKAVAGVAVIKGSKQKRAHSSKEHGVQDGSQLAGKSRRASCQMIPHFSPLQPQQHTFVCQNASR
ncbi:zinc finger protein 385D isoform X1 [Tachysurus ichikawai]